MGNNTTNPYLAGNPSHSAGRSGGSGNTSVITDNGNGTYTHSDGDGNESLINTRASSNPFDNSGTDLLSADVNSAIIEVNEKANVITSEPYVLSGPEDNFTISGTGSEWEILLLEYDPSVEVDEPNISIQARLFNGTYTSLTLTTTWEQAMNDWVTANITVEKFYFNIQLPSQNGVLEYSARTKHKE